MFTSRAIRPHPASEPVKSLPTRKDGNIRENYTRAEESTIDDLLRLSVSASDTDELLGALQRSWPSLVSLHGAELRRILDGLPPEAWDSDPWLVAAYASSYRTLGGRSRSAAIAYFSAADTVTTSETPLAVRIAICIHHSAALRMLGRLHDALSLATSARDLAAPDTTMQLSWRIRLGAKAALQRGITLYHLGDYDAAMTELRSAASLAEANLYPSEQVECFAALAAVRYSLGEFGEALEWARRARQASGDSGLLESAFGAAALIVELLVAVEQNRIDDALGSMAAVESASTRSDWAPLGLYSLAAVSIISEHYVQGLELLRRCLQEYRGWRPAGSIVTVSEGLRATLLLRLGETDTAWEILGSLTPTQHHANCPARFIAHLRFVAGDTAGALAALHDCEAMGDKHSSRTLVDVQLLKAAATYRLGSIAAADVAFDRALLLAAHNDMRIPFRLIPHSVMRSMLERATERPQPESVRMLFAYVQDAGSTRSGQHGEPLSDREREIVRALVRELTANQIADELFISVNTVKSHLKNVYRKLGVGTRAAAVRRARELGHQL